MRKQFLAGKALLLCLLYFTAVQAAPVPASLQGHWLKTDGSNRFVIGIYSNVACYENETWRISSAKEVQGRWQLQLEKSSKTKLVTVQRKDSVTLLLGDGVPQELKNVRTFNYRYHPEQPAFRQPLFTNGSALLKGLLRSLEKRGDRESYVQLSYTDMRTGNEEYLFAELDSLDCFSLQIPLHMPVFCKLKLGYSNLAGFFIQPGDTLLMSLNDRMVFMSGNNTNYNSVLQRICFMGSTAAFNNQFQHYERYKKTLEFKPVKPAATYSRNTSDAVKQQQFNRYAKVYDSILHRIDLVYPAYAAEQRFIDFVKAETRYSCVLAMLEERNPDSLYLRKIYDQYLAQETPVAFVHDNYYKLAGEYGSRLHESRYGNRYSYTYNLDKITERVQKDYGPLLSNGFLEKFNVIKQDWDAIYRMKDSVVIQKYFNGSQEAAINFRFIFNKITNEFHKESRDSNAYRLYEATIPNACLRFAANLKQLQGNNWGEDDIPMPSIYRIAIFNHYSRLPDMPDLQITTVNTAQALLLGAASLELKQDSQRLRQIDHEAEWQKALQEYRGKTVIVWTFHHYFQKDRAARGLYELQKMQDLYRGKNVVFLKCIQQRQRSDKTRQLLQYLALFNENNQLNDVFYINRSISAGAMMEEAINNCCAIYDSSGQAHHPVTYDRRKNYTPISLSGEIDSVLTGKGHFYEKYTEHYLHIGKNRYSGLPGDHRGKAWLLFDSTGGYYLYVAREFDKPVYELNYDTVYHMLSFTPDTLCMEYELVFHRLPSAKSREMQLFSTPDYRKSFQHIGPLRAYRYDSREKILRVYDDKKKLYRSFRVAFINLECMVLELIQ